MCQKMVGVIALAEGQDKGTYKMKIKSNVKTCRKERKCKNCTGYDDYKCYRRPLIELFLIGPRSINPENTCINFNPKTR
jgi:hypothetical protein